MIIMHNEAREHFTITYAEWFKDYLKTGKYKNFTVTNPKDVVQLHRINQDTGEMVFSMLMDKKIAEQTQRKDPRKFHIKPLEYKMYDKNLVPNEEYFKLYPDSSIKQHFSHAFKELNTSTFFQKIKQRFKFVPRQNRTPFTRYEMLTLLLMTLTLLAAIIIPIVFN